MEHLKYSASKKLIMEYWNGCPITVAFLIVISFFAIGIIIINYVVQSYTKSSIKIDYVMGHLYIMTIA